MFTAGLKQKTDDHVVLTVNLKDGTTEKIKLFITRMQGNYAWIGVEADRNSVKIDRNITIKSENKDPNGNRQ